RRRRFEEEHRIVRRRILKINLGETSKTAAPQRKINRPQKVEERLGFQPGQRVGEGHDRVVQREIVGLRIIGTEVSRSALVEDVPHSVTEYVDVLSAHGAVS